MTSRVHGGASESDGARCSACGSNGNGNRGRTASSDGRKGARRKIKVRDVDVDIESCRATLEVVRITIKQSGSKTGELRNKTYGSAQCEVSGGIGGWGVGNRTRNWTVVVIKRNGVG